VRDGTESDAVALSQFYIVDEATNASLILPYIPNALRGADSMGAIASQPKMSGNDTVIFVPQASKHSAPICYKIYKVRQKRRAPPAPAGGAYSAVPDTLAGLMGERREERERKRKGKERRELKRKSRKVEEERGQG